MAQTTAHMATHFSGSQMNDPYTAEDNVFDFYHTVYSFDCEYRDFIRKYSKSELFQLLQCYTSELVPKGTHPLKKVHDDFTKFELSNKETIDLMYQKWQSEAPTPIKLLYITNQIHRNIYISDEYHTIVTRMRREE